MQRCAGERGRALKGRGGGGRFGRVGIGWDQRPFCTAITFLHCLHCNNLCTLRQCSLRCNAVQYCNTTYQAATAITWTHCMIVVHTNVQPRYLLHTLIHKAMQPVHEQYNSVLYIATVAVLSSCSFSVVWDWSGRFYTGSWSLHAASPPQVRDQLQSKLCSNPI